MAETKSVKKLNIPQKLAEISKIVDVFKKETKAYNFSYVNEEAILEKLTVALEQQKLELYPMIVPGTAKITDVLYDKKKPNKEGTQIVETIHETIVSAEMIMRWINLEDTTETMDIPWLMVGEQSDASQAFGSGLSYCVRYFYLKFFHIATTKDDPDAFRSKQAQLEEEQAKAVVKAIIDEINSLVGEYIGKGKEKDKEKEKDIKKFLLDNNNDDMDYTKIKDAEIASALRAKVKDFVRGKTEE